MRPPGVAFKGQLSLRDLLDVSEAADVVSLGVRTSGAHPLARETALRSANARPPQVPQSCTCCRPQPGPAGGLRPPALSCE